MQRSATLRLPATSAGAAASRWWDRLRRAWKDSHLDADECYLRGAADLAELEQRLRRLERGRGERFAALASGPGA
jgi:hypothetical protein